MSRNAKGLEFLENLATVIERDVAVSAKLRALWELLNDIFRESVKDTGIRFHTLFSIMAYAGHKYPLPKKLLFNLHRFRREVQGMLGPSSAASGRQSAVYELGVKVLYDAIRLIYDIAPPLELLREIPGDQVYAALSHRPVAFKKHQRVLILRVSKAEEILIGFDHDRPEQEVKIRYNVPDRNENFTDILERLEEDYPLPLEANLIDVEIDEEGHYLPKAFVLQPDFLIDITSVADCFRDVGISPATYLVRKFLPVRASKYIMLGHIANFFLDELMARPSSRFQELIQRVFQLNPLAFTLFDDATSAEIVRTARKHFVSLKEVVNRALPKHGIVIDHCFLEPTFYSERYGLQGRLDVLHDNPEVPDDAAIIELKSGKPFRPNVYGLSHNHYIQTLLYDLLIRSVSDDRLRPTNYILYSISETEQLRFAPAVRSQQYEALKVRNVLIRIEHLLAEAEQWLDDPGAFLSFLKEEGDRSFGFTKRDMDLLAARYEQLMVLEQKYLLAMISFIAREHRWAKTGVEGERKINGQASLWLNDPGEKEAEFSVLGGLRLADNLSHGTEPILTFERTEATNPLANFRKGDLALLYPQVSGQSPLRSQLFKGTITHLAADRVEVRLRAKQFNDSIFAQADAWIVEHDSLDSSFYGLYRALFAFTGFDLVDRKRFLSLRPPSPPTPITWPGHARLTEEQNRVMQKILSATDYFLLWGPPGTGKTSLMLRHLVEYLLSNTEEQLMVLAYTNRAVDEICQAFDEIGGDIKRQYLRIGSRYATHPDYVDQLLTSKMQGMTKRADLKALIRRHRIIVGTLSSVQGKPELFDLKHFDRLIVDEATQVLEPMMAGILPRFEKILLIGDHRQLAAVVAQSDRDRRIDDASLRAIGVEDLGNSYFERLIRRYKEEGWSWAYDRLSQQGRMHRDIMAFPSKHFYNGLLQVLPEGSAPVGEQAGALNLPYEGDDLLCHALSQTRSIFLPVPGGEVYNSKTNDGEAELVRTIMDHLASLWPTPLPSIGIITPYRAQIARIRHELEGAVIPLEQVTIDTVERFQGGARDIIIISLCVNGSQQLKSLVSLSSDGVDRKLNVALTRARKQLIMLGDPVVLSQDETYAAFIDDYLIALT